MASPEWTPARSTCSEDRRHQHPLPVRDPVQLDLVGALDELRDHDGMLGRDARRLGEETAEVVPAGDDPHRLPAQDVRRPDEDRVPHLVGERARFLERRERLPGRLRDRESLEQPREAGAVLGRVDRLGRGPEDRDPAHVEERGQVLGELATDAGDDPTERFEVEDVPDALERDLLEVEPVRAVVVGGDGLGVRVEDRDTGDPLDLQPIHQVHGRPVELHARADPIRARADDEHGPFRHRRATSSASARYVR